ncbi:MAG: pyridoxamine 5'-phosphate oxidase family protein [Clostridia bacterium]|nr:pyridoxamine 5'-phosphate oxidase family protein [Clostridia bacterium]
MRRKDREVQSLDEIFDILNRCDTVRVAFRGEDYPYVVPVSFGTELADGKVTVYFHCAREGFATGAVEERPAYLLRGRYIPSDRNNGSWHYHPIRKRDRIRSVPDR